MYNIIFTIEDMHGAKLMALLQYLKSKFRFVHLIPEMRKVDGRVAYQGNVSTLPAVRTLRSELSIIGVDCDVIGVWQTEGKNAGLQQGYTLANVTDDIAPEYKVVRAKVVEQTDLSVIDEAIVHPFNFNEYRKFLIDRVTVNDEHKVVRSRPTAREAQDTQVASFFANKKRDLTTYV
jgi:hypothetical protein